MAKNYENENKSTNRSTNKNVMDSQTRSKNCGSTESKNANYSNKTQDCGGSSDKKEYSDRY